MTIRDAIIEFAHRVRAAIEGEATERARATVLSAFGLAPKRGPGRPPKALGASATNLAPWSPRPAAKARKKAPTQLCPVPGCKNPAAPALGMVCAKHRDVPKPLVKKYREARRAKKLGLKAPEKPRVAAAKQRRSAPKKVVAKKPSPARKGTPPKVVSKRRRRVATPGAPVTPPSPPPTPPPAPPTDALA